jgi:hypothetical protein
MLEQTAIFGGFLLGKEVIIMKEFFNPEQARFLYPEIVPVYQAAFAGEPWFEVTKCADDAKIKRCVGGFSALAVGETCKMCGNCPIKSAYETEELVSSFESIARTRPTAWYLEGSEQGITLAAIAWVKTPLEIVKERYPDSPKMSDWIISTIGNDKIIWLDEVFADKSKKPSGNLSNFGTMCKGFANNLSNSTIACRTINDRMLTAAKRDFPFTAKIFKKEIEVPDRRDFVILQVASVRSNSVRGSVACR